MLQTETIAVFDSQGDAYRAAFRTFLEHTDQKEQGRRWLSRLVESLPARRVFIDAGAGNGKVTAWFADRFQRTIAIEPNPHLRRELVETCPNAEALSAGILAARPAAAADFVLCSHVFYYIGCEVWLETLGVLASWLAPQGALVVALQNHDSDCMRMIGHFYGRRFDLSQLAAAFRDAHGAAYRVELETTPASIRTPDFDTAETIAEFMLNLLPLKGSDAGDPRQGLLSAPARADAAAYIRQHFDDRAGGYRFSCDQDFLVVRRG